MGKSFHEQQPGVREDHQSLPTAVPTGSHQVNGLPFPQVVVNAYHSIGDHDGALPDARDLFGR